MAIIVGMADSMALHDTVQSREVLYSEGQSAALRRLKFIEQVTLIIGIASYYFIMFSGGISLTSIFASGITLVLIVWEGGTVNRNIEQLVRRPEMMDLIPDGSGDIDVVRVQNDSRSLINQVGKETIFLGSLMNFLDQQTCFKRITNLLQRLHRI